MKIIHSVITDGLSGTAGTSTFMRSRSSKFSYRREWAQPARTQQNDEIGEAAKNIGRTSVSLEPEGIEDLKKYAKKYKHIPNFGDKYKERAGNWFAILTLALYNIAKAEDDLSLVRTSSVKEILQIPECKNVSILIDSGFLPKVDGWELLTNDLYST